MNDDRNSKSPAPATRLTRVTRLATESSSFDCSDLPSPLDVILTRVENTRRIEPEVDTAIELAWTTALARPGVRLFDGPMCRLESAEFVGNTLHLQISDSRYKIFLGTNMAHPEFAGRFGRDVMANPVGVSTLVITADAAILLGRRNQSVAYYPGRVHPFAGSLEPTDVDVFSAVRRELAEELSITADEIAGLNCVGLVEDVALFQPELIFITTVHLTFAEIQTRLDPAEHDALYHCAKDGSNDPLFTPVAAAALRFHRQRLHG